MFDPYQFAFGPLNGPKPKFAKLEITSMEFGPSLLRYLTLFRAARSLE